MTRQHVITARIDEETLGGLARLSEIQERSRAWLIAKAVERYVKEEIAFHEFVQEGENAIDRGDFLTQEEMEEWVRSLRRTDAA
ncbi:MAG TPA: ribbon-helix-helix protein, CopG family [Allosphingosinicella sp.]